ncbi:zinc finger protein 436-like isoform X1 [Periplaneta americana]|uniref:zinc finger protein 436-like isoform X1 n=1 Tax=Periplaneta americana TaxID=6978 RepID=UPI0037E80FF9
MSSTDTRWKELSQILKRAHLSVFVECASSCLRVPIIFFCVYKEFWSKTERKEAMDVIKSEPGIDPLKEEINGDGDTNRCQVMFWPCYKMEREDEPFAEERNIDIVAERYKFVSLTSERIVPKADPLTEKTSNGVDSSKCQSSIKMELEDGRFGEGITGDTNIKRRQLMSHPNHEMSQKTDTEQDPLTVGRNNNTYVEDMNLFTQIKKERLESIYDIVSEVKIEENPVPNTDPVMKRESEQESHFSHIVKEELNLSEVAEEEEATNRSDAVNHNNEANKNQLQINHLQKEDYANVRQSNENSVLQIRKRQGSDKLFKCEVCGKGFTKSGNLNTHARQHTGDMPFKCDVCGKPYSHKGHLEIHVRSHTGEKPHRCVICAKSFTQIGNLKRHAEQHSNSGDKLFKCIVCGKCFSQLRYLIKHERLHSQLKHFKCNVCGKDFTELKNLKRHGRVHTGEKPFKCTTCDKLFPHLANLKAHERLHTGERPFNCNMCGKTFPHFGSLKSHSRLHSGETPFKCGVCGRGFSHPGNLKSHARLHTGEKPFKCDFCEKCFSYSGSLKTHVRLHTGEKPFKCNSCGKCFTHSNSLKVHERRHK